tara:strand:- start:207 stop:419 length:213 start_codon:yes stop_codon:yes gene_type:complete
MDNEFYCYRCGNSSDVGIEFEISKCKDCGEEGLLSIITALDLLNDLHLKGLLPSTKEEDGNEDNFDDFEE